MRPWRILGAAAVASMLAGVAWGADYPSRPIRLIHGFGPGGPADTIARVVANPLSEQLGRPVVVEAKPGAGGNIGADAVAKAAPDGYTIGLVTGGHAVSAGLYKSLPFDPVESFEMVSTVITYAFVLVTRPDFEAKSVSQLVALAKANPGKFEFGSAGIGTTQHLTGELLRRSAGIDILHVPYKGDAAAMAALLGGEVPMIVVSPVTVLPQVRADKATALAVSSATRWSGLPDTPTVAEGGVEGFDVRTWAGILAPKGTPRDIVMRLNAEIRRAVALPEVKNRLEEIVGGEVGGSTPEAMREMVASEAARWTKLIREAKIPQQD